jgi:SAM-dependent methyltransferase
VNPLRWAKAEVLHFAWKRGRYTPPDRRLFEEEILPALAAAPESQRILSVGVAWYTKGYARMFEGRTFATLDFDPERAAFGAAKHVVGDLRDLERHFDADEPFDVVLMNGVIGYGLDVPDDVDRALQACAARMRRGGTLVLGINELKPTNVDPTSVPAHALFEPRAFGKWPSGRVTVPVPFRERTHTFLFWKKR